MINYGLGCRVRTEMKRISQQVLNYTTLLGIERIDPVQQVWQPSGKTRLKRRLNSFIEHLIGRSVSFIVRSHSTHYQTLYSGKCVPFAYGCR